ncbi:MAG: T9SS type A sorting domain-containing protein [Flavobacteriales bacterium]
MRTRSLSIHTIMITAGVVLFQDQAQAQLLEQQDLLPPLGSTWHMRALQLVPELPPDDRPLVWPYADLVGNDVFGVTWSVIEPGDVPGGGSYPSADVVMHKDPDNDAPELYSYLDVQADRCLEVASNTPFISNNFDPGALHMAFPLQFNTTVEGGHCYTAVSATDLTPYCGTTVISFEKLGTLQLNFGEFSDARLVRTSRSNVNQLTPADSSVTETLTWYRDGSPYPLLQFITVHYANGNTSRSGYILDPSSVVGWEEQAAEGHLNAYPVPSAGVVNIAAKESGSLSIVSSDGRLVHVERLQPTSGTAAVDLSTLPPGAYRAVLRNERTTRSVPILISR